MNYSQKTSSSYQDEIRALKHQLKAKEEEIENLQKEIQEQKSVFDTILEGSLAGYWDWYIQDDYEYMSPTFKKMFGYKDHEIENVPTAWQEIVHQDDLPKVFETFNEHINSKGKIPYDNEVRYHHKDGSVVWVYCRGQVIEWDDEGNPLRMVGCHVDITPLKKVQELSLRNKELNAKNKELEQFTYIASHDLQEPLRTVRSFAHLLEERYADKLDKTGVKFTQYINQSAERMSDLIKALLDHSRIGKKVNLKKVSVENILVSTKNDLFALLKETNAQINFNKMPCLYVYPVEFKLLLQNLIRNAIKFQPSGNQPVINITAQKEKDNWKFAVQDNGIGIQNNQLEEIFVIFRRLHLRSEYAGTGIGLAHCKKIVELHNGKIWAESEVGKGSTFYFTIPL